MKHHIEQIKAAITGINDATPDLGHGAFDSQKLREHREAIVRRSAAAFSDVSPSIRTLQEHVLARAQAVEDVVSGRLNVAVDKLSSFGIPQEALDGCFSQLAKQMPICKRIKEIRSLASDIHSLVHCQGLFDGMAKLKALEQEVQNTKS